MPDWRCPKCGVINLEGQRACEGCGDGSLKPEPKPRRKRTPMPRAMLLPRALPPPPTTTAAQQIAAVKIMRAVAAGEYDAAEGCRRIEALFRATSDTPNLPHVAG